jgi:hypothetical protein
VSSRERIAIEFDTRNQVTLGLRRYVNRDDFTIAIGRKAKAVPFPFRTTP